MKTFISKSIAILLITIVALHLSFRAFANDSSIQDIRLTLDNTVSFREDVNELTIDLAIDRLTSLVQRRGKSSYPIYVVLDTPGGLVDEGIRLSAAVAQFDNVYYIVYAGYSMGGNMPQLTPRTRYMVENGMIMLHHVRTQCSKDLYMRVDEIASCYKRDVIPSFIMYQQMAKRIGMSFDEFMNFLSQEMYLQAKDAKDLHLVDKIITISCSKALKDARQRFPGGYIFSRCPLDRKPKY